MHITLHKNARTPPAVRLEWQRSDRPVKALAARYNISETTVRKGAGERRRMTVPMRATLCPVRWMPPRRP